MAQLVDQFPNIAAAAKEITYDSGGINRRRTEAKMLHELNEFMNDYETDDLRMIDEWLGSLSEWDLTNLCTGDQEDQQDIMHENGAPFVVDPFLNEMFEQVC